MQVGPWAGDRFYFFVIWKYKTETFWKNMQTLFLYVVVLQIDIKQAERTNLQILNYDINFIQSIFYKCALFPCQILMTVRCGVSVTSCVKIVWDITSATVWKVIS